MRGLRGDDWVETDRESKGIVFFFFKSVWNINRMCVRVNCVCARVRMYAHMHSRAPIDPIK